MSPPTSSRIELRTYTAHFYFRCFLFLFFPFYLSFYVGNRIFINASFCRTLFARLNCDTLARSPLFPPPRKPRQKRGERGRYDFCRQRERGEGGGERESCAKRRAKWNFDCFHSIMPSLLLLLQRLRSCSKLPPRPGLLCCGEVRECFRLAAAAASALPPTTTKSHEEEERHTHCYTAGGI